MTRYVVTKDEDDISKPYKPIPRHEYLRHIDSTINAELAMGNRLFLLAKSRRMVCSWYCLARCVHRVIFYPGQEVYVQSRKVDAAAKLIYRAESILRRLPAWQTQHLRMRPTKRPPAVFLANGSILYGVQEGRESIRGEGASIVFSDELDFQDHFLNSWAAIKPALGKHGYFLGVTTPNGEKAAWQIYSDAELRETA